jgi:predicted CopG family antitoxin
MKRVVWALKTVRVSDEVHRKLTRLLGERMAKTGKAQTFNGAIEDLISKKCRK